ncbi:PREDICTED: uncharacterized protein LOC102003755 [Chinchilla lanigera]|uniref:uncharacterized protein LOC102003755 n=1 Tax=Chinchilla lanigera TaxID=34839 RepID=UPI00038EFC68|nr:PREDICTED: uncharacterized protein LOC102003755 [Chinchilla lanigera]
MATSSAALTLGNNYLQWFVFCLLLAQAPSDSLPAWQLSSLEPRPVCLRVSPRSLCANETNSFPSQLFFRSLLGHLGSQKNPLAVLTLSFPLSKPLREGSTGPRTPPERVHSAPGCRVRELLHRLWGAFLSLSSTAPYVDVIPGRTEDEPRLNSQRPLAVASRSGVIPFPRWETGTQPVAEEQTICVEPELALRGLLPPPRPAHLLPNSTEVTWFPPAEVQKQQGIACPLPHPSGPPEA